jgi:hypothetical protein
MTWITHTTFAYFVSSLFGLPPAPALLGSTAPDWTEDLFGVREHRGKTHYITLWSSAFLLSLVLYLSIPHNLPTVKELTLYILSFTFGALTHLFTDSLTISGVPLGTGNIRIRIGGLIRTGKLSEWIFLAIITAIFYPLSLAGNLELGFSKYRNLYSLHIIDRKEYDERKFHLFK